MKIRTKKGIVDTTKQIDEFSKTVRRLGDTASKAAKAANGLNQTFYLNWKSGFIPQTQAAFWAIQGIVIILAIAEIVWYMNWVNWI